MMQVKGSMLRLAFLVHPRGTWVPKEADASRNGRAKVIVR